MSCKYEIALQHMDNGEYDQAIPIFEFLTGYKNSKEMLARCQCIGTWDAYMFTSDDSLVVYSDYPGRVSTELKVYDDSFLFVYNVVTDDSSNGTISGTYRYMSDSEFLFEMNGNGNFIVTLSEEDNLIMQSMDGTTFYFTKK